MNLLSIEVNVKEWRISCTQFESVKTCNLYADEGIRLYTEMSMIVTSKTNQCELIKN